MPDARIVFGLDQIDPDCTLTKQEFDKAREEEEERWLSTTAQD